MKKIIFICLIFVFLFAFTGLGYSWTCDDSGCNTTGLTEKGDIGEFKTSKNVEIRVTSSAQAYAAIADHLNGDRAFGASSDSTKIFYTSKTEGQHYGSDPSNSDSSEFSGWTSL